MYYSVELQRYKLKIYSYNFLQIQGKLYSGSMYNTYLIGDDKFPDHLKIIEDWLQCSVYVAVVHRCD